MIKKIFKNKVRTFSTISCIFLSITAIAYLVCNLGYKEYLRIILIFLFILIIGSFFLKRNYPILNRYFRMICDAKERSQLNKSIYRYGISFQILGFVIIFFLLRGYLVDKTESYLPFSIQTSMISMLIISILSIAYYTTTKRFLIDFRPKNKRTKNDFINWFECEEKYNAFIALLKENQNRIVKKTYYEMLVSKENEIDKSAIIRRAYDEGWFKNCSSVGKLKKMTEVTFKIGHSYIDKPKAIKEKYSPEDLDFLRKK